MICSAGLSLLMSSTLQSIIDVDFLRPAVNWALDAASYVFTALFFTGAYMMIPNAKVRFGNAIVAGAFVALAFQVLQWIFVTGQMYVTKYNAIYGSFSFLPLMLIWLQLVWLFTLIYNNSTSASSTSRYRYYNNGNVANPSFTLTQASSSWTPRGWSTSNQGNAGITYANGATFTRDSDITLYGLYQQTVTVTYYNNSTTASTTTGTRYWAPAGSINPSFTLTQAGISGLAALG